MPLPENEAALAAQLTIINDKWLSLTDYKQLDHTWTIGQNTIASSASGILVNGLPVSLSYDEPVEADYRYPKTTGIQSGKNLYGRQRLSVDGGGDRHCGLYCDRGFQPPGLPEQVQKSDQ